MSSCTENNSSKRDSFEESREQKRVKVSRSFSFVNSDDHNGTSFRLSSGSFSATNTEPKTELAKGEGTPGMRKSLDDFHQLLSQGMKISSPVRGASLYEEMHIGVYERQGKRDYMEDRHEVYMVSPEDKTETMAPIATIPHAFFAIYDGHGGPKCVDFVNSHLHNYVTQHPCFNKEPMFALKEGILKTEKEFKEMVLKEDLDGMQGSCVCVALIHGNTLYVASVGDSGAILCRKGEQIKLTYPHTPKNPSERQRVLQLGGKIKEDRLCHPKWNPGLVNIAVTRSLGDIYFKEQQYTQDVPSGLIAEPEITKIVLTKDDSFVFMASDGYWDVVSTQETVNFVTQLTNLFNASEICQQLTQLALQR